MKRILLFVFAILCFVGCDNMMNTPTKRVEEFLNKFQTLDDEVLTNLSESINQNDFTEEEKDNYNRVMKRQYQDLVYKIKDEIIDGNHAIVKVEIEVYDYNKAITEVDDYFIHNQDMFLDENGMVDNRKYIDYKIEFMSNIKDRVKYTIEFYVDKKDDMWTLNNISEEDREKIHGLFSY